MTVEELDKLCIDFLEKKAYQEKAKSRMDDITQETKDAQTKVIAALQALGKTENEGGFGKVKIMQREYYKMTDKEAAMNWLKDTGHFDHLASVNARTFSSHIKELVTEKRKDHDFAWMAPGVEDATSDYTYLKVT